LLKTKKDYVNLSLEATKHKDERDYFKMKLAEARKLNQELIKETDRKLKKHKTLQIQNKTNRPNSY
jgi:hypothetical protein